MAEKDELSAFRKQWKAELRGKSDLNPELSVRSAGQRDGSDGGSVGADGGREGPVESGGGSDGGREGPVESGGGSDGGRGGSVESGGGSDGGRIGSVESGGGSDGGRIGSVGSDGGRGGSDGGRLGSVGSDGGRGGSMGSDGGRGESDGGRLGSVGSDGGRGGSVGSDGGRGESDGGRLGSVRSGGGSVGSEGARGESDQGRGRSDGGRGRSDGGRRGSVGSDGGHGGSDGGHGGSDGGHGGSDGGRGGSMGSDEGSEVHRRYVSDQPQYVSIAEGLLDGRSSPLLARMEEERMRMMRKRRRDGEENPQTQSSVRSHAKLTMIDQFIHDLNETNDIPFFDVELPYELALKIFQFLNKADLGRCAQVSSSWRLLAEDQVLWYRLCIEEGFHSGASVSDSPCWKSTLRDCWSVEKIVNYNWKNRVGSISHLQYELGKVLCDVSSCDGLVVSGYTSGDVRLWNTLHWDSGAVTLQPARPETPAPHVGLVRVTETLACAAYENGCVSVWSTECPLEPIHHYQHLQRVDALDLSADGPVVTSSSGSEVRVDSPDARGYWKNMCIRNFTKPVDGVLLVPGRRDNPLVSVWTGESVYLLDTKARGEEEEDEDEEGARLLHSVYGQPVTCLDVNACRAAMGVKSCGWGMSDGGNKVRVYSLETGQAELALGNSVGDFTCINLRDAPPHLLVCGNKDRRVRVFDLRSGSAAVVSLYAHHLGVTAVQADEWKIVSGGGEGLVCVWEMRMGAKLWEMHNRHPVRHVRFNSRALVTANIPDEKRPRGACITDDDLTAHRRHRGAICYYDFSVDSSTQDHVLPICRSDYVESSGYNYNIGLSVPYDTLAGPHNTV